MAFEELKDQADQLEGETRAYIDTTFEYYKLWSFKVAMKSTAMAAKVVLVMVCLIMVFLFASIAIALAIGNALDNYVTGFLIIGGFYLFLLILIILFKDKIVEGPMLRKYSEIFFND
jgi:ABC-type multidrug transport system fused ATPase/permease subunit